MENSSVEDSYGLSTNERIGIYGGIISTSLSLVFFRTIFSFLICLAAARNLHNKMFKAILRAPVLFFDTNPVGMLYLMQKSTLGVKNDMAKLSRIMPESECMKRLATRSDIRMHPRLSILKIHKYYTVHTIAIVQSLIGLNQPSYYTITNFLF